MENPTSDPIEACSPPVDYSAETHVSRSRLVRFLCLGVGTLALCLGVLGIFLPILPTTPLLLLTAACYARGSVRFYNWLLNNRLFGPFIRDWRVHKSLPLRTKVIILAVLWVTIITTSMFFIPVRIGQIAIYIVPIGVTYLMVRIPTRRTA